MGDALEIVALAVGKVIHGVAVPLGACAVVGYLYDAVDDGVAEVHVGIGHVEFGAQHHRPLYGLGRIHLLEETQVLLDGAVAEGTGPAGLRRRTLLLGNLFGCLLVDIGQALLDEPDGKVPELLEIVGGIVDVLPVESQPLDVAHDVLHIFRIFLGGVGVVEAKVADAAEFLGDAEVHTDGFGVADVDVSVGLWRESRLYASAVLACFQVFLYHLFHKTEAFLLFTCRDIFLFHIYI